jgi:hypothetical protein
MTNAKDGRTVAELIPPGLIVSQAKELVGNA